MKNTSSLRYIGFTWAVIGITALLSFAIVRMSLHAADLFRGQLSGTEWFLLVLWVAAMAYAEGYRGFQRRFSPRFAARALSLTANPRLMDVLLAPLFCIGYYRAAKDRLLTTWSVTLAIILLVLLMNSASQPWRNIISTGVLVGLLYGLVTVLYFTLQAIRTLKPKP